MIKPTTKLESISKYKVIESDFGSMLIVHLYSFNEILLILHEKLCFKANVEHEIYVKE